MNTFQFSTIIVYGLISILAFIKGFFEVTKKNNPFGEAPFLLFLGIFVWSDAVIIGLFGLLVSLICLLIGDWILFLLIISIFWVVRSLGEIIYWINEQFSPIVRNPPETLLGYKLFKNDSIWFIYQLYWQMVMVASIVFSILLIRLWV